MEAVLLDVIKIVTELMNSTLNTSVSDFELAQTKRLLGYEDSLLGLPPENRST